MEILDVLPLMFLPSPKCRSLRHSNSVVIGGIADVARAARNGAFVEGFGCRPMATMRLAPGPASESLQ
jgi:hypothetical protein